MASHRFEDPKGIRRSKIADKFWSVFKKDDDEMKKKPDREPHELYIELHELNEQELTSDIEWFQVARWIKYEEDVEKQTDRWGKPKISSLDFHSLLQIRQCFESGSVLLDLEEDDMESISKRIVDELILSEQIEPEMKNAILNVLSLKHRHINEKSAPLLRRNSSGYGNLNMLSHDKNRSTLFSLTTRRKSFSGSNPSNRSLTNGEKSTPHETAILMDNQQNNPDTVNPFTRRKSIAVERVPDRSILRRVPENSEAVVVLVGQLEEIVTPASVFIRLSEGRDIPNVLEIPLKIRFIFVLLGPKDSMINFHEIGRAFCSLMSNKDFRSQAYTAMSAREIRTAISLYLDQSIVLPPVSDLSRPGLLPLNEIRRKSLLAAKPEKAPLVKPTYDPLQRTNKVFGGFIQDIKHRYPFYWSDIKDGLTLQCLASIVFIYFAAISSAVAFGGLLADKTELNIGVSETLIGTSVCGVIFALFSGQPLIIIGTTGPLLLFDQTLYELKDSYSADFLVMRLYVGIWTAIIACVVVAAEGSSLVKFFTRFVQEIFATIISLIFIYESLYKLYMIFVEHPLVADYCGYEVFNSTNSTGDESISAPQPNTALLSTILMIGTFYIAFFLRHFRNSKFLGRSARRALGDFGVPIGIIIMVSIDYLIRDTYTQKLIVPEGLSPSVERDWIIYPVLITAVEFVITFVGGLIIFILLFLETQICELIISKKPLRKGSGFHIDMVLVGLMAMVSGFIGGPWQCAATVRAISHLSSLIVWSRNHAPGEPPYIVEVKEQRLTNFMVALLIGVSVVMAPVLRQIPLAVLFGVFLYMGISSLSGIHLFERILLIFMPTKHHPDFAFVRKVKTHKMHLYTGIQVLCLGVLWLLKSFIPPAFPFGLLGLIAVHQGVKRLFTNEEMQALDEEGVEEEDKDDDEEPDFYEQIVA